MTAVFVANDQMALGLLRAMHERGRRVPEEVSVVGFDDIPEAPYFLPPLTTVRQDFDQVGSHGVRLLLRMIEAGRPLETAPATATGIGRAREHWACPRSQPRATASGPEPDEGWSDRQLSIDSGACDR